MFDIGALPFLQPGGLAKFNTYISVTWQTFATAKWHSCCGTVKQD
jgi:hypothetical protein